ncbi:MAG: response regulator, partial [Roseiflexaceae bacterium]|nr:response regulator [Roseiflexaceae bacterium]
MAHRLIIVPGENETLRALPALLPADITAQVLESANDALWEVRNTSPEVVIADVDLPGMSGLDLAEILPAFGLPTRVILCSRQPDPRGAQQAQSHGVYQYLDGPVSAEQLNQALRAAIQAGPVQPPVPDPEPVPVVEPPKPVEPARPAPRPPAPERPQRALDPALTPVRPAAVA